MADPERRRAAIEKRLRTRAELGPRIGYPASRRRGAVLPPSTGGARRRSGGAATIDHPTRDSPA